jgi:hypothetical protein
MLTQPIPGALPNRCCLYNTNTERETDETAETAHPPSHKKKERIKTSKEEEKRE